MKCDKCGQELNFYKMRIKNLLETGELGLPIWLVVEYWHERKGNIDFTRRELRTVEVDEKMADKYVDYLNYTYEDRYPPNERPLVSKEKNYLGHFFAMSMDYSVLRQPDERTDKIEMLSDRKWNDEIGDIEITPPLSDEIVSKMLLKYGEKTRLFYLGDFIDAFSLDKEQVRKILGNFLKLRIMKWVLEDMN